MPQVRRPAPPEQAAPVLPHGSREGSRWIGNPPTGEEVAKWFADNVTLHEGLEHGHYVGGLVLIPNVEKIKRVNGQGSIFEQQRLVHTPYVKVETRVAYFHDYVAHLNAQVAAELANAPRFIGELVPVRAKGGGPEGLPDGFFRYAVQEADGKTVNFVGCTMQARVRRIDVRSGKDGYIIHQGAPATKLIATVGRFGADPFATMKAETGAIGRALGLAGMLVIPGSGVATAEDMAEVATAQGVGIDPEAAALPADEGGTAVADATDLRSTIAELTARLESESPEKFEEFVAWAKERKVPLDDIKEHQLRGVLRQLERRLAELEG